MSNHKLSESQIETLTELDYAIGFSDFKLGRFVVAPTPAIANRLGITNDAAAKRLRRLAASGLVVEHFVRTAGTERAWRFSAQGRKIARKFAR